MKFLILFFPLFILALSLSEILSHPKSYVRDFYLTEFMKETNSSILAFKAYNALYKQRRKHLKILSKFSMFKDLYRCVDVYPSYLREVEISCILNNGLSLRSISKLKKDDLLYLYKHLPSNSKEKKAVYILLTKSFDKVFNDKDVAYYFMLNLRNRFLNQPIIDFSTLKSKYFYLFIKFAVLNRYTFVQKSLDIMSYSDLDDQSKWWLFLNAMLLKHYDKAHEILYSFKKVNDKIYFWRWLFGDKDAFKALLKNPRVNFYTLYAYEEAKKKFYIKRNIIYYNIDKPKYDQRNPWDVLKFFNELKQNGDYFALAAQLDSTKSEALKALVLDKAFKYKYNFFITPKMYEDKNKTFKAYVYAIARQESRFIPASVSRSYALGTMQIMPFLIRSYKGDVFNQFDYNENIKLGVKHLKWLFKRLNDYLFVAYAYNGGIGFVKREVKPYFRYKGRFEPFLSMELVRYDESREYGKKVIANFVIYSHLFGNKEITLHKILKK